MQTATIGSYIRDRERKKDTATHTHTTTATKKKKRQSSTGGFPRPYEASYCFLFLYVILLSSSFFFVVKQRSQTFLFLFFFVVVVEQSLQRHLFFFSLFFPRSFERKQRSDTKKGSFSENKKDVVLTAHIRNTTMTLGFGSLFKITRMGTLLFLRLLSSSSFF